MAASLTRPMEVFAADVGGPDAGPVTVVGGRSAWAVGGSPAEGTREVRAPVGVVAIEPAEMTVRVRAGTTVADLDAELAGAGQCVALPDRPGATVGGVLAVGWSGVRRLGWGPVRDTVLEARVVTADGAVVKAGGPTVKNVSGYDLCRLLVGSLGTLALIGELVLRTRPVPAVSRWLWGRADPFEVRRRLFRPNAILWDGTTTWVLLEGHGPDVDAETAVAGSLGLADCPDGDRPDLAAHPYRWSLPPSELTGLTELIGRTGFTRRTGLDGLDGLDGRTGLDGLDGLDDTDLDETDRRGGRSGLADADGRFLAEIGVGVVHVDTPPPIVPLDATVDALHERVRSTFDPTGRLNPGRDPRRR